MQKVPDWPAEECGQTDLRKEIRHAHADVRVGGDQGLLGLKHVRSAAQKFTRQTGGNLRCELGG